MQSLIVLASLVSELVDDVIKPFASYSRSFQVRQKECKGDTVRTSKGELEPGLYQSRIL